MRAGRTPDCHPERRHEARGLCKQCYNASSNGKPRATCHPDRRHHGHGLCAPCYGKLPSTRARNNASKLRMVYGLDAESYERLMAVTHCELCGRLLTPGTKGPHSRHIDHDHATGKIRGVLCRVCNVALGSLGDDRAGLLRAVAYLERAAA